MTSPYRNGPSTPPCGTPLPGITHSVQRFLVAALYLLVRRYFPTKSRYGSSSCRHTSSMSMCGVLGNAPFTSTVAWSKSYKSLSTLLTIIPSFTQHVYSSKAFDAF